MVPDFGAVTGACLATTPQKIKQNQYTSHTYSYFKDNITPTTVEEYYNALENNGFSFYGSKKMVNGNMMDYYTDGYNLVSIFSWKGQLKIKCEKVIKVINE